MSIKTYHVKNLGLYIGISIVSFWIFIGLFAPLISPYSPYETLQPYIKPSLDQLSPFFLGTDHLGRDIVSRIFWGTQIVLLYGFISTFTAYFFGITLGLLAGYKGGIIDETLSRIADIVLSFPVLVLYIIIISTLGASGLNIVIAITFANFPYITKIVRSLTIEQKNMNYVIACRCLGYPTWKIIFLEIFPNIFKPLSADYCLRFGYVIITIGVLGFLGLGLPPPTPDWGSMISETKHMALIFPHMVIFPCIAISSLVLGFNLISDGLQGKKHG